MPAIKDKYENEVVKALMEEFSIGNIMEVPRIKKIVINIGLGEAVQNPKVVDSALEDLRVIAGQQPVVTRARLSIAGFKLREGMRIGCRVTLRRQRMYEFLERLISVALPRVRDFRGVSTKAFDGQGNYSLGIREQIIFPEIDYDKIDKIRGMNITIVTSAPNDEQGRALLRHMGMPFRR
jgi:large subunit ribosomal protein L5